MDPNAALEHIRRLAQVLRRYNGSPASAVNELVEATFNLDEWITKGGFLPDAWERKIDVIHWRDPDSECGLMVYVNGVRVEFGEWGFDPGRGYEMEEFEEDKRSTLKAAPKYLKPILEKIYNEMEPTYRRWSL